MTYKWIEKMTIGSEPAVVAKVATAASAAGAGTSLLAITEWVQFIAGLVAIVAGIGAAWWHFERIYDQRKLRKKSDDDSTGHGSPRDSG